MFSHFHSFHSIKDFPMLHSYTPLTLLISTAVFYLLQIFPNPEAIQSFRGEAGIYAFIFIIVDRLLTYLLKFRKDPIEKAILEVKTQAAANGAAVSNLATTLAGFIGAMEEIEKNREQSLSQMRPAINDIQKGIAVLVDRQKSNDDYRAHGHSDNPKAT